ERIRIVSRLPPQLRSDGNGSREPFQGGEVIFDGCGSEKIAVVFKRKTEPLRTVIGYVQTEFSLGKIEREVKGFCHRRLRPRQPGANIHMHIPGALIGIDYVEER